MLPIKAVSTAQHLSFLPCGENVDRMVVVQEEPHWGGREPRLRVAELGARE